MLHLGRFQDACGITASVFVCLGRRSEVPGPAPALLMPQCRRPASLCQTDNQIHRPLLPCKMVSGSCANWRILRAVPTFHTDASTDPTHSCRGISSSLGTRLHAVASLGEEEATMLTHLVEWRTVTNRTIVHGDK